ncbi:MAG: SCO1664 family protein [Anaerolineales bacterium]
MTPRLVSPPLVNEIDLLQILRHGRVELTGQFVWGSNHTFLTRVVNAEGEIQAVYKPSRGEQPLWDFPEGSLAARETAAYLTSRALDWDLVPPTVLREDGPAGPGSVQLYVEADSDRHYFTFTPEEKQRLRPAAIFDLLINNADRKGGHVLLAHDRHLWLIDHGVCFHRQDKLRTVIWDFIGEPIPDDLLEDLRGFRQRLRGGDLRREMGSLLSGPEVAALERRADRLLSDPRFPPPGRGRPYPWPMV